jgi:hypothetical protein
MIKVKLWICNSQMVEVDTGFSIYNDGHVILRDRVANLHMQTKTTGPAK